MWPVLVVAALLGTGLLYAYSYKEKPGAAKPPPPIAPAVPPTRVVDASLAPQEKNAVQQALVSNTSPSDLENFAATLKPTAPQAASQLDARAKALRAKGVRG